MPSPRAVLLAGLCLVVLAAAPAAAQATAGPVAAYGFEDTGPATAGDSSAFGNAGSVQGAVRAPGRYGTGDVVRRHERPRDACRTRGR